MTPEEYVESSRHLPECIRDFHDAKDVFKLMHWTYAEHAAEKRKRGGIEAEVHSIGWTVGQCYVIDLFLWFMAKRGYTLQRSRAKGVEFRDLDEDIQEMKRYEIESLRAILQPLPPTPGAAGGEVQP